MHNIKEDDNITLEEYAKERGIVDDPGWKWSRIFTKNPHVFIIMAKTIDSQTKLKSNKYKYDIKFTTGYVQVIELDKENGNTLWQDALEKEVGQIKYFNAFKAMKVWGGGGSPKGYQRIPFKLVFDFKFYLISKYSMISGGRHTEDPNQDALYRFVYIYVAIT